MEFTAAKATDLNEVTALYRAAIERMNAQGIDQWDERYPTRKILAGDIVRGEMGLLQMEGRVAAAFTLNDRCDAAYALGAWRLPSARYCVIHRLCVHPAFQGHGVAGRVMDHIERTLRTGDFESIRLDAFSQNPFALRLYEKRGYEKVGEVSFRKGLFFLYEKTLQP